MKVDGAILSASPGDAGPAARRLEELGFVGGFTFEGPHDPFLPLAVAAEATERLELATAVAIGLVRSPMTLAQIAYDLQLQSRGRFTLGLGSQVRAHVERRYGATWSRPVARMREVVAAIRAIWASWHEGVKLDFRGEFYTHTLMPPIFNPGPSPYGLPRIWMAGVGARMTEVVGEIADGHIVHPLHTAGYLERVLMPALERGLQRSHRRRDQFDVSCQVLVATGDSDEALETARSAVRMQIAFYGSTPAYRHVLEHEGLGALHHELHRLSRQGGWTQMAGLIDDALIDKIATVGRYDEVARALASRYQGIADRVSLISPATPDATELAPVVHALAGVIAPF
jgi:probable F420-dependent oxidoreductase